MYVEKYYQIIQDPDELPLEYCARDLFYYLRKDMYVSEGLHFGSQDSWGGGFVK